MPPVLDHIIILVPYAQLLSLPAWIPSSFTLTPGGRHSDDRTENKLVCFADGSYLELIAFINDDPKLRDGHKWGSCEFGIIDFALTQSSTSASANWSSVNARLAEAGCKARYAEPLAGGRLRDDGQEVRWSVTAPVLEGTGVRKGELPFFCHDVTPRSLRVPDARVNTTHPNSAYGVKGLCLYVPEERVKGLVDAYEAILGTSEEMRAEGGKGGVLVIGRLRSIVGVEEGITFTIRTPEGKEMIDGLKERGGVWLGDLVLGGLGNEARKRVRIDVPAEDGVGGLFLELDVPV
ncbi:hypothetical protein D0Z07_8098 [Hyphodiscus hymeniophilus]|uniref:Glyoxalase-like domain-containing protein n=1 Tax=Hyphodiscus hymeniophilus TaxID=353542 RepID=A0A9P6VEE5_9HELO|nr:hypothetical protein D0Z07_8098 [Hyphodiscus hymeniophilus]